MNQSDLLPERLANSVRQSGRHEIRQLGGEITP